LRVFWPPGTGPLLPLTPLLSNPLFLDSPILSPAAPLPPSTHGNWPIPFPLQQSVFSNFGYLFFNTTMLQSGLESIPLQIGRTISVPRFLPPGLNAYHSRASFHRSNRYLFRAMSSVPFPFSRHSRFSPLPISAARSVPRLAAPCAVASPSLPHSFLHILASCLRHGFYIPVNDLSPLFSQ